MKDREREQIAGPVVDGQPNAPVVLPKPAGSRVGTPSPVSPSVAEMVAA